ncbi:MAG: PAS domain S-box protein [Armatimonadota bacterium]
MKKRSGKLRDPRVANSYCKRHANEPEASGDSYRQIFDAVNDSIIVFNKDTGAILDINRKMIEVFGFSPEEIQSIDVGAVSLNESPYSQVEAMEWIRKAAEVGPQLFEWRSRDKTGRIFWTEVNLKRAMIEGEYRVLAIVREITERKQAEIALRKSEQKLRRLYDSMTDAYASLDLSGRILDFNEAFRNMVGYSVDELHSFTYRDFTPQKWHDIEEQIIEEQVLKRGDSDLFEKEYIRKDGTIFPVELRTYLMRDDEGKAVGYWAIVRDITERKRAESALKDSERRLSDIIDFLPDPTFAIDTEGRVIAWNRATEEMTGVKAADMIGKCDQEYSIAFYGYKRPMLLDIVLKPVDEIKAIYNSVKIEGETLVAETYTPILKPSGAYLWFRSTPLYDTKGRVIGAIESVRDVTERKLAEEYKKEFYRRTIMAATDGKLMMTEKDEIYKSAGPTIAEYEIKRSEDIGAIRAAVVEIACGAGMDDSDIHDFAVSIGEVCTNALKHASGGEGSIHHSEDSMMFIVTDHGPGIEAMTIPQVAFVKGYTTAGTLGMGYKIMISLSDHVYIATSDQGTTVGIEMRLHKRSDVKAAIEDFDWAKIRI